MNFACGVIEPGLAITIPLFICSFSIPLKSKPQFYVRTTDVTGNIELPSGVEMVMPGDNLTITVDLIQPIACSVGLRFAIREGGRTVGAGQVTEILV